MAGEMTSLEKRTARLEAQIQALQQALASVSHKANQAAEDSARQFQDQAADGNPVLFRMQSVGVITASSGANVGNGTARYIKLIGGTRYLTQAFAMGDVTAPVVNDSGSATINNEYLMCAWVDGVLTALYGDCATLAPSRAPDPPA